jgi:hypothetical protein
MKANYFRKYAAVVILVALCALVSCTEKEVPEVIKIEYALTGVNTDNVITFGFGQEQSFAATAANVDYLTVIETPKAWSVTAVNDRVKITPPEESATDFDRTGKILIRAYNRTVADSISISLQVEIDESLITPELAFTSNHPDVQYFTWGQTQTFTYQSKFVKDIEAGSAAGWVVSVNEQTLTLSVTAPAGAQDASIVGDVELQATPVNGAAAVKLPLAVAISVYKVDISNLGDAKLTAVYNDANQGVALISKEYTSLAVTDEVTVLYPFNDGYQQGYVFENGGSVAFDDPTTYAAGTADTITELTFAYDGTILTNVSAEVIRATTTEVYTVSDAEGNVYPAIKGGAAIWTDKNLKSRKAPDGSDLVFYFANATQTDETSLGLLYSTAVALNGDDATALPVRGICPQGWHLPSVDNEVKVAIANPYYIYHSLINNAGGIHLGTYGYQGAATLGGNYNSTGVGYGAMNSTVRALTAANNNYGKSVRCIKNSAPFAE